MISELLFALFLLICAVTDICRGVIYLRVIIPFSLLGVLLYLLFPGVSLPEELAGVALGILILCLSHFTGGKIGTGDGLLVMVSGLFLGIFDNLQFLMLGMLLAALLSVVLLVLKKADRKTTLPFAPFLMVSYAMIKLFSL